MATILKPRSRRSWSLSAGRILCACAVLAAAGPHKCPQVHAADKLPDLETIRAAVNYYTASVKALEGKCVMELSRDGNADQENDAGRRMFDLREELSFSVDLVQGRAFVDEENSFYYRGKKGEKLEFETRTGEAWDGARSYALLYTHIRSPVDTTVPAGVPNKLNIGTRNGIHVRGVPWDAAGLRLLLAGGDSLATQLRQPGATVDGIEDIGGIKCVRVSAGRLTAWMDPTHEYLPRRLELRRDKGMVASATVKSAGEPLCRTDVVEFRKFPDGDSGKEMWFPTRSQTRVWFGMICDCEVTELRINPVIDPRRFSILPEDLPPGVQVTDVTAAPVQVSYTGGQMDEWQERNRLYDEESDRIGALLEGPHPRPAAGALDEGAPRTPAVIAQLPAPVHWSVWLLLAGSAALIVLGAISAVRARRA